MLDPDHRELLLHSCDAGTTAENLGGNFPDLSFDGLVDVWWHQGPENEQGVPVESHDVFLKRIDAFVDCIAEMADQRLAIVGHGNVFMALTVFEMENCEIKQFYGDRPTEVLIFR